MKPITDRLGRVIDYENAVSDYRKEIRSRFNALLGWYDPHADKTHDRSGYVISKQWEHSGLAHSKGEEIR